MVKNTKKEFNTAFSDAIDETIREILGPEVLASLHRALLNFHDVTREEMPYRLDTVYAILENTFGFQAARTLGRQITFRLYRNLGLEYADDGRAFADYIEAAKRQLAAEGHVAKLLFF